MSKSNRPVPTKCWKKFLQSLKCYFKRQTSSHHIWRCPKAKRSIVFRGDDKEIPLFHIKTNLQTLGIMPDKFWKWIEENC